MKSYYTVFTLSHPLKPLEVRFVGMTSQTVTKRLHDIISASCKSYNPVYSTPVGEWVRDVVSEGKKPTTTPVFESHARSEASQAYRDTLNANLGTGLLLNAVPAKRATTVRTEPFDGELSGRAVDPTSQHAADSARRKTK